VPFNLQLEPDTFIDPNNDILTLSTDRLPSWLTFDAASRRFSGTPTDYGTYEIRVHARDAWNGTCTMEFTIVAGIRPNRAPFVV